MIRERLIQRRSTDGFVTDFGTILSLFFRDPVGLEGEVCVPNPDAVPGVHNPPATPAAGYSVVGGLDQVPTAQVGRSTSGAQMTGTRPRSPSATVAPNARRAPA